MWQKIKNYFALRKALIKAVEESGKVIKQYAEVCDTLKDALVEQRKLNAQQVWYDRTVLAAIVCSFGGEAVLSAEIVHLVENDPTLTVNHTWEDGSLKLTLVRPSTGEED